MAYGQRPAALQLTIGVVGSADLVEQIMLSGTATPRAAGPGAGTPGAATPGTAATGTGTGNNGQGAGSDSTAAPVTRRLVAVVYRNEQEAGDRVLRLGAGIDVWLFANRVPHAYARQAGVLRKPATCVPLGGSALYAALLRAAQQGGIDLSRLSVDVLTRAEVEDAFADMGLPVSDLHVREEPASAAALAAFHERLWRRGATAAAVTCLEPVAQRLTALDIPALVLRPTRCAIASALHTATLLGTQRRLEDAQLAVAVVEVPTLREPSRRSSPASRGRNCGSSCTVCCCRRRTGSRPRSARPARTASWSPRPGARWPAPPTASASRRSPSAPAPNSASCWRWESGSA